MNKLSTKFIVGVFSILLFTTAISLFINSSLVARLYSYEKRNAMEEICDKLEQAVTTTSDISQVLFDLENTEEVTIVHIERKADTTSPEDLDEFNGELQQALREKGIGFQKFWLWDEDYKSTLQNGRQVRIYNQGKLNYNLLVEYMQVEDGFYAVAMIIPHISDAIGIVNTVTTVMIFFALLVSFVLITLLVRRITRPLLEMERFAMDVSAKKFHPIEIHTHDELERVAKSMNQMCVEIERYQGELVDKNRQMALLLDNVAHDLKTPVALVKVYTAGMQDGMDDGSFLETIIRQNDRMSDLIERLLMLSCVQKSDQPVVDLSLDYILLELLEEQSVLADKNGILFETNIVSQALVCASPELVTLILSNLLSNAIKYSSGQVIEVALHKNDQGYLFSIKNQTDAVLDTKRLWEPFYVGEPSRNKSLSGTGLGLALVRESAKKLEAEISCERSEGAITFQVFFRVNK